MPFSEAKAVHESPVVGPELPEQRLIKRISFKFCLLRMTSCHLISVMVRQSFGDRGREGCLLGNVSSGVQLMPTG